MPAKRKSKNLAHNAQAPVKKEEQDLEWDAVQSNGSDTDKTLFDAESAADPLKLEVEDSKDLLDDRPKKRQRVVLEVVAPTKEEVAERKANEILLKEVSKIKKKKGEPAMVLDDVIQRRRLDLINNYIFDVQVPLAIKDQHVTRRFMASNYGGSMQATRPAISEENVRRHGFDKFAYLHSDYHVYAPGNPGHPGMFYGTRSGRDWEGDFKVFTKDPKKAIWGYKGEYKFISVPSLTVDEWMLHTPQTRAHWANEICNQRWGSYARSRIQARKELGGHRPATEEEAEAVRQSGRWERVTAEEVLRAYNRGEESMGVWVLKCVGYDEAFQRRLCDTFPGWRPPPPEKKGKGKRSTVKKEVKEEVKKEESVTSPLPIRSGGKKRKRSETIDRDLQVKVESDNDEEEADGGDLFEAPTHKGPPEYRPRGTRSRPARSRDVGV